MGEVEFGVTDRVMNSVQKICQDQKQPPISNEAWKMLAQIGETNALKLLEKISRQQIKRSFSGLIYYFVKNEYSSPASAGVNSPFTSPINRTWSPSSNSPQTSLHRNNGDSKPTPVPSFHMNSGRSTLCNNDSQLNRQLSFEDEAQGVINPINGRQSLSSGDPKHFVKSGTISEQMTLLSRLEFRKLFLVLSYIGKTKLEDAVTVHAANAILSKKDVAMLDFESEIWNNYGNYAELSYRSQYYDWDGGKTHLYYCHVQNDGSYRFKGPCLDSKRTHLQNMLGDDNVLIVKFFEVDHCIMNKIAEEGIVIGCRRYRFFVFKDERKGGKKNLTENENKVSSHGVKCYFVNVDPGKSISDVRRLFMHIHTIETIEKYMARFSLILSKTIKLQIDLDAVRVITIDDIPFRDENGCILYDEEGNVLIHTDGTGYISEDLAMKCPKDFTSAKHIKDNRFEKCREFMSSEDVPCPKRARNKEPPLLMQCRLFHNGSAVKGTLLVNRKLEPGTIQVRSKMIKVERDETLPEKETFNSLFNSLEIVAVSHRPGRNFLSKNLIALLSYGGVPQMFFLDLLTDALEDTRNVFSNRRAALRAASNHDGLDYGFVAQRMISSGIPLDEPYLQFCLSNLEKDGKVRLKEGKIPIADSFYLMGTADPTCCLDYDEVCIIFDHGPIVGEVLVYRHPGLHFGDVHVMKAVEVKGLEEVIGNSKYGIFFCSKGWRSAPYEMATGDFDGDMYWVSKNSELLKYYKANEPWKRKYITKDSNSKKVPDDTMELERELFRLFVDASVPNYNMGTACHSWLSYMDRLLTLREECLSEKNYLKTKMLELIDIYYDALDAPKSGKKVNVPSKLIAELFPHHMGRNDEYSYHSTSILGKIHDMVVAFKDAAVPKQEIWKLPCFDVPIPEKYMNTWKKRYDEYRTDMTCALSSGPESKNNAADDVMKKYKQLLYDADDMEKSLKNTEQIYEEALAVYHVTYNYAMSHNDTNKCGFAWKVAGSALYNIYAWKIAGPKEKPVVILPSVLRDVLH